MSGAPRHVEIDDAEAQRDGAHVRESISGDDGRKLSRRRERTDRGRKVRVGALMPGNEASETRKNGLEIPAIEAADPRDHRITELQYGDPPARREHARELAQRALGLRDVA